MGHFCTHFSGILSGSTGQLCKILTSFYCNHAFNVISMAPRGGTLNGADKLFPAVEAAYRRTVDALRAYPAQQR